MTTIHTSPPPGPGFSVYEDSEHSMLDYDADTSFNSETSSLPCPDDPIASIEDHDDTFSPSPRSSTGRRISTRTTTSLISELPSELSITSRPSPRDTHYTPMKERPLFRNPSSVRALQMASPPPFESYSNPRDGMKGHYKLSTPSRRSETPSRRSVRSQSIKQGQTPTPSKQQIQVQQHYPLVLLHVTLLPLSHVFPPSVMAPVAPAWLVENYRLLEEKFLDTVLMQRGLLIPHPKDEYDVLEERLLESLELKMPRLLKCGHFTGGDDEDGVVDMTDSEDEGRESRMSGGTITAEDDVGDFDCDDDDASVCTDCHRLIKKPGKGAGSGTKRWDIKIYAANGLMRAGAWGAAWSEMERVDVEISPWIPKDIRESLERRQREEEEKELLERKKILDAEEARDAEARAEEKNRVEAEREAQAASMATEREAQAASMAAERETQAASMAAERLRIDEEARRRAPVPAASSNTGYLDYPERPVSRSQPPRSSSPLKSIEEIPLSILLKNYIYLVASDRRNIAIALLSAFVLFLSLQLNAPRPSAHPFDADLPALFLPDPPQECNASPVTITATSIITRLASQDPPIPLANSSPSLSISSASAAPSILASEHSPVSEHADAASRIAAPGTSIEERSPASETPVGPASHTPSVEPLQPVNDASPASPSPLASEVEATAAAEEAGPETLQS